MKTASAEMVTFLDSRTIGIMRHLITVTPRSGGPVYWTDHTSNLVYGGNTYLAGGDGTTSPVIVLGGYEQTAGLEVTTLRMGLYTGGVAKILGVPLPLAVLDGTLDGAAVEITRVFGEQEIDLTLGALWIFSGYVGTAGVTDYGVDVELESGVAALRTVIPKIVFQPGCTATLYDAQCALVKASFTVEGVVAAGATSTVIPSDRTEATGTTNSLGYFGLGVLVFTDGDLAGETRGIRSYSSTGGTFTLDRPLSAAPAEGDTFNVYPGCPKTKAACENNTAAAGPQFNNLTHFRGFPFIPATSAGVK